MEDLVPGIYQHYKGGMYEVLHLGRHSETEEHLVIYRALYGERGVWVRPYEMFVERLDVDGRSVPRFMLKEEPSGSTGG
ncbi:MAG: DUF1653 domain-containing protein [Pseudomonadota bacterium]